MSEVIAKPTVVDSAVATVNNTAVTPKFSWCSPELRAAPNCFLRSNLFAANGGKRKQCNNDEIKTTDSSIKITYTGEQLCVDSDFQVYLEILDLAKHRGREFNQFQTTAHQLLARLNKETGGGDVKWLKGVIDRLVEGKLTIESEDGRSDYKGSLIHSRIRTGNQYSIDIDKNLGWLFVNGYCRLNPDERDWLTEKPLAQWLHGFYSSNVLDLRYLYNVESIHELCGSNNNNIAAFKQKLKIALNDLYVATEWMSRIIHIGNKKNLILVIKPGEYCGDIKSQLDEIWAGNQIELAKENDLLIKFQKEETLIKKREEVILEIEKKREQRLAKNRLAEQKRRGKKEAEPDSQIL